MVTINTPNLPAPTIVVNSVTNNDVLPYPQGNPYTRVTVNVTATPNEGIQPGQTFGWAVVPADENGIIIIDEVSATGPTTSITFKIPLLGGIQADCEPQAFSFVVKGWVTNTIEHTITDAGSANGSAVRARTLEVSPTSHNYTAGAPAAYTFTVTGSDSNLTVIANASWINIVSVNQCSSFIVNASLNTGTARSSTVQVNTSNGTQYITITQAGTPPPGGGPGGGGDNCSPECYWNGTRCICP
jgi:hypothetical protein